MKEQPGLENVAALILERQRIENWLATLDARKASTPDHVYQRVRGDYANRLKAIERQSKTPIIFGRASPFAYAGYAEARCGQRAGSPRRGRCRGGGR